MPPDDFRRWFLLRGSFLLIGLLTVWWFLLLNPLVSLLHASAEALGALLFGAGPHRMITETPAGAWGLRVPLEAEIPASLQPGLIRIHSVEFDLARSDIHTFTFSLPVFWAIMLAAPWRRRDVWRLCAGTALIAVLETILFLAFVEIEAHKAAGELLQLQRATTDWLLHFAEYLVVMVIPYLAPFLIAIALHRELRSQMFRLGPS